MSEQEAMLTKATDQPLPDWAERIRDARMRVNLTQGQLGKLVLRSQQTINGYESGSRQPDVAVYHAIAKVCGVHPAWLIFGDEVVIGSPGSNQSMTRIVAECEKDSRHFAWAFQKAAEFLAQESVDADFAYVFAYTQKLLGAVDDDTDDARTREAILRTIELDRQELRRNLEQARKRLL